MIFEKILKELRINSFSCFLFRVISSLLIFNFFNIIMYGNKTDLMFASSMEPFFAIGFPIFIFLFLTVLKMWIKNDNFEYILSFVFLLICSTFWILGSKNILFVVLLFCLFLLLYKFSPNVLDIGKIKIKNFSIIILATFSLFTVFSIATVLIFRYKSFFSPNFDYGIFVQNFHYLRKSFVPLSTLERNGLLSHFSVHISPIFYLILPFSYLFSSPLFLQIVSIIAVVSGIIPVYKICKFKNFKNSVIISICFIYSIYTPIITGTYFDFHENILLLPLLLWMIYFYEKDNKKLYLLFLILSLLVKEDVFIYTCIFAVYSLFDKKQGYGIYTLAISIIYFMSSSLLLSGFGEGVMSKRFDNLIIEDQGLIGIIRTVLINPGYFLSQLVQSDQLFEKLKYFLVIYLPLGFIPLISKKFKNYILILPIVINLMTTYSYNYDINYHYSFGICALAIYAFILNIEELKFEYLSICIVGSILVFSSFVYPNIKQNFDNYYSNKEMFDGADKFLSDNIPENASVSASAFIIPHIANRDIIYEDYYHENRTDIDYVVLDMRYDYFTFYNTYLESGYIELARYENFIVILKKNY